MTGEERDALLVADMERHDELVRCEWYARCTWTTTRGIVHPILGLVPCCARCAARHDGTDRLVPLACAHPDQIVYREHLDWEYADWVRVSCADCGATIRQEREPR